MTMTIFGILVFVWLKQCSSPFFGGGPNKSGFLRGGALLGCEAANLPKV